MFIAGNLLKFCPGNMQLWYQFTEQHLCDSILNAEQFAIHGGNKAFFCIQKFSFLPLSSIKTLENEDEWFSQAFTFHSKEKGSFNLPSWRTFLFCPCYRHILHSTCGYHSKYNLYEF